ncbi:Hypothetical predicted protein [Lecanosticta acicola]|uniref:Uncharacterized protein n=1 Tax=Lecanosticta acicola TaxID=111012 RepID=A0AAI8YYJ8_9PEZI|nr:Hypothetical predicted protein [Lecanosticta acicola]
MPYYPGYGSKLPMIYADNNGYLQGGAPQYTLPYSGGPGTQLPAPFGATALARGTFPYHGEWIGGSGHYATNLAQFQAMSAWMQRQGGGWRGW